MSRGNMNDSLDSLVPTPNVNNKNLTCLGVLYANSRLIRYSDNPTTVPKICDSSAPRRISPFDPLIWIRLEGWSTMLKCTTLLCILIYPSTESTSSLVPTGALDSFTSAPNAFFYVTVVDGVDMVLSSLDISQLKGLYGYKNIGSIGKFIFHQIVVTAENE